MSLYDVFPAELQDQQLTAWLVPGAILYLHCSWIQKNDQNKFVVVGCTQPECVLLLINTDARRSAPIQTQVVLTRETYPEVFTRHSHVDCNKAVTQLTFEGVTHQLRTDGGRYRGALTAGDQQQVLAAVKFAHDMSDVHQEMICNALEDAA